MMAIRLINPRYFCVGDSPERMETCLTLLGVKERQLLYFLGGQSEDISRTHYLEEIMVATTIS
jgi:hypothetical protein